jgi:hypothetical protein
MFGTFVKVGAASAAAAILSLSAAQATTVTVDLSATNAQETVFGIDPDSNTRGNDMAGMGVTVTYADNSVETLTWAALNMFNTGGVSSTDFDLRAVDATFSGNFLLDTGRAISSILLQSAGGNAVFDAVSSIATGPGSTENTLRGSPFSIVAGDMLDGVIAATYSGIVNVAGDDAQGDIYTDLLIDFTGLDAGAFTGAFEFAADMDSLFEAGDLTPVGVSAVPLPAGLPLLLTGFGAFGLMRLRKKQA